MTTLAYVVLFFGAAVLADWLTVLWHDARDRLAIARVLYLGAILEGVNWVPFVFAIDGNIFSAKTIALINITGSVVGSGMALWRLKKERENAIVIESCSCICSDCGLRR